jgi:hypothetical protein
LFFHYYASQLKLESSRRPLLLSSIVNVRCRATPITVPHMIRAWRRRSAIEHFFRALTHLLATEAAPVQQEDACDGHLAFRLVTALVLLSTTRVICKGRGTMEELLCSLKHSWRFLHFGNVGITKTFMGLPPEGLMNNGQDHGAEKSTKFLPLAGLCSSMFHYVALFLGKSCADLDYQG